MPTKSTSKIFNTTKIFPLGRSLALLLILLPLILFSGLPSALSDIAPALPGSCSPSCLALGKANLDKGDYEQAIIQLTSGYQEMPFLGDYALSWRSRAYEGVNKVDKALEDLRLIRKNYPESPLTKAVRMHEIELAQKAGEKEFPDILHNFIIDYPSDSKAKFIYAAYLKNSGDKEKAKAYFKEIYISVSPFSKSSGEELSSSDIKAADLLKKGQNLNSAWLFADAEKCFRSAMRKNDANRLKKELSEGLAYSLFRQKKYKDAAALFSDSDDRYWKAKSLYRAGEFERFEIETRRLANKKDSRAAALMIALGTKKRRGGDTEGALSVYDEVLSRFPSAREDALWNKGWTYYRTGDYGKALDIFSSMHKTYGDARYAYWQNRCLEALNSLVPRQTISIVPNDRNNNFYLFISALRSNAPVPPVEKTAGLCSGYVVPQRIAVLESLGLKKEALSEIVYTAGRKLPDRDIACLSTHLNSLNDFKTAMALTSRIPYREDIHELYYPPAYLDVVDEAARSNGLDPFLVLSIMREESRFASDARSVAGALGLMQLMPQTASKLSKKASVPMRQSGDLYDARINVLIGSYYLKLLINDFGSIPLAIAAYNAGEESVKGWLSAGHYKSSDEFIEDIPYDETRIYVKKVMNSYFEYLRRSGRKDLRSDQFIGPIGFLK